MKIYKYQINILTQPNKVELPVDSQILHWAEQNETITFWAKVDPTCKVMETHEFFVYGTGHSIPDHLVYVSTVFIHPFVWHVFTKDLRHVATHGFNP